MRNEDAPRSPQVRTEDHPEVFKDQVSADLDAVCALDSEHYADDVRYELRRTLIPVRWRGLRGKRREIIERRPKINPKRTPKPHKT